MSVKGSVTLAPEQVSAACNRPERPISSAIARARTAARRANANLLVVNFMWVLLLPFSTQALEFRQFVVIAESDPEIQPVTAHRRGA
jgi:hypothetical protein